MSNVLSEMEIIKDRYRGDALSLLPYGYKVFSQSEEDGITFEIFNRIGKTNKKFIEIGVGNGLENNTLSLLFDGWQGVWIDGGSEFVKAASNNYNMTLKNKLIAINSIVTVENVDNLICDSGVSGEIDLLSIDIDGNDAYILESITSVKPRVIIIEYNAKFGPIIDYCIPYSGTHERHGTDYYGASLKHLEKIMEKRSYNLVACNLSGANAFFVRSDLCEGRFSAPFTSEHHFQPARYWVAGYPSGHPASYKTLESLLL
jgi:hypothetical protein